MNFAQFYGDIFASFGYPLGRNTSLAESTIDRASRALNVTLPAGLRDFYLIAGREKRFNQCHHRIIAPKNWRVSKNRLIFLEENQWVVWWGVSLRSPDNDDPPVSQAVNEGDEELDWYQQNRRCSVFIAVMLHYQAVSGGLPHYGNSPEPKGCQRRLKRGWRCFGTVNRLTAYSRQNQVVCIEPELGVAAAAKTQADLQALQDELGLDLS